MWRILRTVNRPDHFYLRIFYHQFFSPGTLLFDNFIYYFNKFRVQRWGEIMNDEIYKKLAKVLDTLPSGFPQTENGVEIKLLKKLFTPEEADLFCDLKLFFETVEEISM